MTITVHRIPYGDKAICANAYHEAEHIVREYLKFDSTPDALQRMETMAVAAKSITKIPYNIHTSELDRDTINWLLAQEEFWRKPAHVQLLETQLWMARADLKKRQDFLAWLTTHIQSPKFQGEGNAWINTHDLLHALREHGVYGG